MFFYFSRMKKLIVKYSIEFLVIFFGITISFTLQEYSKQNASLKKQQDGLKRVMEDLKLDEFIFELTLRTNTYQIQASKQILNNSISNDNYNLTVPYFGTFLNDTAIKSLMSTGLIEGYGNQELITDLLKYYRNDYDFVKDQSEGDEKLMFQRLEYVTKNFEIDSVSLNKKSNFGDLNMPYFYLSKEVLSKLQKDKIYRSFLNNIIYIKIAYNNFVGSALKKNRELQTKTSNQIKLYK